MPDINTFLLQYGLGGLAIAVLTAILTEVIKSPIKDKMAAKAESIGIDKSVFTKWLALIPLALAFVGSVVNVSGVNGWANPFFEGFQWPLVVAEAGACWGLAVAFYETGDNIAKSITTKSNDAEVTAGTKAATAPKTSDEKKVERLSVQLAKAQQAVTDEETQRIKKAEAVAQAKAKAQAIAQAKAEAKAKIKAQMELEAKAEEQTKIQMQLNAIEKERASLISKLSVSPSSSIAAQPAKAQESFANAKATDVTKSVR